MNYLLSPHDDDSVLFAAFTCLREHPLVIVVADSYVQPARGEVGCSADERAEETARAHQILGCPVLRLGLRDDDLSYNQIVGTLPPIGIEDVVYAPVLEGGHPHHDLTARAALDVYGPDQVRCYSTYARRQGIVDWRPRGTQEVVPTPEEIAVKMDALRCYRSQIRINWPHFSAVLGRSEWLSPCCEAVTC